MTDALPADGRWEEARECGACGADRWSSAGGVCGKRYARCLRCGVVRLFDRVAADHLLPAVRRLLSRRGPLARGAAPAAGQSHLRAPPPPAGGGGPRVPAPHPGDRLRRRQLPGVPARARLDGAGLRVRRGDRRAGPPPARDRGRRGRRGGCAPARRAVRGRGRVPRAGARLPAGGVAGGRAGDAAARRRAAPAGAQLRLAHPPADRGPPGPR